MCDRKYNYTQRLMWFGRNALKRRKDGVEKSAPSDYAMGALINCYVLVLLPMPVIPFSSKKTPAS